MITHIRNSLLEAKTALDNFLADEQALQNIERAAELLIESFEHKGKAFSCGNGGSMCDAMHFAEELTGRYRKNRPGIAAISISDASHISCVANDFGYDYIFSRYIESHGREGDVLLAISTSGKSPNVLKAAEAAKALGIKVIALTGKSGSQLETMADVCICAPGGNYADRVQELHIKVIHILMELIERTLSPDNYA
ncbi:D-sedoheptulose 7-phosphate isomerase [Pseudomonas asuensis]|jgi:D-sedoheptulose 7-phosphate isomerase|uniref:Phosphoheptose isomerase n=1 Tax=Pseudomonas asuensis TaxID=1825787 RepID=A0ABQ2GQ36_9PSED|nr:D-sedoheptulose 7-phosphate isomerase [Pseudomonas asuensis]GGM06107.1 phosphoheptose isomerase [Pseudomonas asuensis]